MKRLFLLFSVVLVCLKVCSQTGSHVGQNTQHAIHCLQGLHSDMSKEEAILFLRNQADSGDVRALHALGIAHQKGLGCEIDPETAMSYFSEAGALGYANAWLNIGLMYANGDGIQQDFLMAESFFLKAVGLDSFSAYYPLGYLYYYGLVGNRDFHKAFDYFEKAANGGHAESMYMLGMCYKLGNGCDRDYERARTWFEAARLNGIIAARSELEIIADSEPMDEDFVKLRRIYPNPFEKDLTIDVFLDQPGNISIVLSTLTQRNMFNFTSAQLPAGENKISITPNIPSGLYVVEIVIEGIVYSQTIYKKE